MIQSSIFALCLVLGKTRAQSALELERALTPPTPTSTVNGEQEGSEFWASNASLLSEAWEEYGRLHPNLYDPDRLELYINHEAGRGALVQEVRGAKFSRMRRRCS